MPAILMHLSRARKTQVTAITAILAVLLLFVAPIVSKSMMHHAMMAGEMAMMDMPHEMENHATMAGMSDMAMHDHSHHSAPSAEEKRVNISAEMSGMACGYCDLLVHVPFLLWVFVSLLLFLFLSSHAPLPVHAEKPCLKRRSRCHHPRAPPFFLRTFSY